MTNKAIESFDELEIALKNATEALRQETPWPQQVEDVYKSVESFLYMLQISTKSGRYEYHAAQIAFDRTMKLIDYGK